MKTPTRTILSIAILACYGFAFVGCGKTSEPVASTPVSSTEDHDHDHADGDHDHDGHDHDDHDGHDHDAHDHPAHGKHGGHMVELSNGANAEVQLLEDAFTVYIDGLEDVSKVQMKTTIGDKETVYEFERSETPDGDVFGLTSPELATAVKMGTEVVQTELLITTADGDLTAPYEHHSH